MYYFLFIIIHHWVINIIDQLFEYLSSLQEKDSTWVSKLIVDIPTPPQLILVHIEKSSDIKNHSFEVASVSSDIITFLKKLSTMN